jgi:hypothetical protein
MVESEPQASVSAAPTMSWSSHALRRHVEELVLILLVLLSGAGVAINDYSPASAFRYWMWMAPTFGVISVAAAWWRARRRGEHVWTAIHRQALHWLGVIGAVYLLHLLQRTGRIANEAAGLAALLTIALASFLAGVHSDWRLMVIGGVLGVTVVGFAVLEQIIWVVVLPLMGIIILVAAFYVHRMRRRAAEPASV